MRRDCILYEKLNEIRKDLALELAAAEHRPDGWLPRTVFVEEDEYEAGFTEYLLTEIHHDGTCDIQCMKGILPKIGRINLNDIEIDFLMLLVEMYQSLCEEQGLKDNVRRCDHCGRPMKEGYYLDGEYACSDSCCLALYHGDAELMKANLSKADTDEGECYYTEWESFDKNQ